MLNQYTYLRVKSDRQLTKIKFCFYLYYHSLEGWLSVLFSTSQRQSINTLITLQINYFLSSWKRWKNLFELREHSFSFFFYIFSKSDSKKCFNYLIWQRKQEICERFTHYKSSSTSLQVVHFTFQQTGLLRTLISCHVIAISV